MTSTSNTPAAPAMPQAELHANMVCLLTGEFTGTLAQAVECNPSYAELYPALPGLLAQLPAGNYVVVDTEDFLPPELAAFFAVEPTAPGEYAPSVYLEWAASCVTAEQPATVYGAYDRDYSMASAATTAHGPALVMGLAGSPLNSASNLWILPAACWPTPEQLAPLKAEVAQHMAAIVAARSA